MTDAIDYGSSDFNDLLDNTTNSLQSEFTDSSDLADFMYSTYSSNLEFRGHNT
jgi:hypothetical protein